jgi:release factor glutamine methyltransferase
MPAESRDHEPRTAVDGGADGMDVQRRVLSAAPDWLAPGGHLLTETSTPQADRLAAIAGAAGLTPRIVHDDDLGATVLVGRAAR